MDNLFGEVIYTYTRAEAIADGELVDVSTIAKEAGFSISVVVSRAVWDQCIAWTCTDTDKQALQDEQGRLWDVLWMLRIAFLRNRNTSAIVYSLYVVPRDGKSSSPVETSLKAVIGGGDSGEPVITIMLPNED